MAASAYFDTVQKLYIAFYQRPADSAGLKYWAEQIDAANGNIDAAIQAFSTQEEAVELYGEIDETTIESVLDSIYFAAFGRSPEQEELDYWVPEFVAGRVTPSNIALAVVLGALGTDAATIDNKLVVANEFTTQVDGRPLTDPAFGTSPFAATYDGYDDVAVARDLLSGVTDDPASILSPEDITTAIVDTIADEGDAIIPVEPPPTFSLTADADSADEGDTVTFTVEGGKANFTYNYELTGVDATDVKGGVLTGSVTTDADGNGTFEVTLAADRATDGADTLTATLPNTGLSASVTVNDTSLDNIAPVAVDATANAIEEGAVVTGQLEATDADDDALTFTLDAPLQGLTLNADGSYSFDPTQNDIVKALTTAGGSTDLVATYTVTDALGATDTGTLTITAAPAPLSFKLEVGATTVNEDGSITFTVTANEAVAAATDVVFTLKPGNSTAADQGTDTTNLNDFDQGAFNPVTKQIAAGGTSVTFTITAPNDNVTELAESFSVQAVVGGQTLTATATLLDGSTGAGKTYMLTKGLDNVPGTAGNDTIIGSIANGTTDPELNTFSALDVINGGAGTDTLKVSSTGAKITVGSNVSNVEIVEASSTGALDVDTTASTAVTNLNVTAAATSVAAKASATTDINVAMKQGAAVVNGADGTAADTKADIAVTGGKNVTVNVTDVKQVLGNDAAAPNNELNAIVVGGTGAAAATGDVVVSSTGAKAAAGGSKLSSIKVEGGKTISVTQKATSDASAAVTDTTGITVTQGDVTVVANAATTDVTVKQDVAVGAVAGKVAVAGTAAQTSVKFTAVAKGVEVTVGGLKFTAAKDLSAAEVAQAFANITKGITQLASGQETQVAGVLANGTYFGSFTATGWTSGAAAGDTVTFTGPKTTGVTFPAPALSASAKTATGATTDAAATATPVVSGLTETKAVTGVLGVAAGKVDITAGAATKTITIDSYAGSSAISSAAALETLNLSNAAGTTFAGTPLAATAIAGVSVNGLNATGTLALNLEKVGTKTVAGAVNLGAGTQVLNVKSTGDNNVTLTSTGTKTLSVDGTGLLTAKTAGLAGTETITVKGAAGLDLTGATLTALKSVDTTATTGAVTVAISKDATYAGGAGNDTVTISGTPAATALTKTVDLGAGNNKLDLTGVTGLFGATSTAKFVAGAGTQDTLVLGAAQANSAAGLSSTVDFQKTFSGFERLEVAASTGANTINLDNLNDINYVISKGDSAAKTAQKAVITLNLTGASLAADGDKITFGGTDLAVAAGGATGILALIGATISVGGVTYDIDKSAGLAAIKLTAQTAANLDATAAAALTLAKTGGGVAPTATAPTLNTAGVAEVAATAALVLDKMLTGATVQLDGVSLSTEVKLAADGAADAVNLIANATNGTNLGTVKAALVETLNITAAKTYEVTDAAGVKTTKGAENVLALDATAAKTILVTGAGALDLGTLTTAKLTALTSIDGSANTGGLKVDLGVGLTNAVTLTGGAGNDVLGASESASGTTTAKADVLVGGAGDDTLYAGSNGATLTGGVGKDLFVLSERNDQATSFSSITDFGAGDVLQLKGAADVGSLAKLTISAAGDISNFINSAIKQALGNEAVYFVQGSDTYVVVDRGTSTDTFVNGEDAIIKLTGVNLDTQAFSFNSAYGTIELV